MKRLHTVILIMLLLVTAGCRRGTRVIPEGEMVDLLVDIHKGEALIDIQRNKFQGDSLKKELKQSIYSVHGVTEAEVDSTYAWYGRHIEDYIKLYDKVIARLEDEVKKADREALKSNVVYAVGDSIDVWDGPSTLRIDVNTPIRNLTFHYDADDNWEQGDNYQLQFKLMNQHDGRDKVYTSLYVSYPDGSGEYRQVGTSQDGWTRVRLVTDSTRMARSVYGSIIFNIDDNEVMYIDSLSLVRTRRLPTTYSQRYSQRHIFPANRDSVKDKTEETPSDLSESAASGPRPATGAPAQDPVRVKGGTTAKNANPVKDGGVQARSRQQAAKASNPEYSGIRKSSSKQIMQ